LQTHGTAVADKLDNLAAEKIPKFSLAFTHEGICIHHIRRKYYGNE
jgi:hypothetical protein